MTKRRFARFDERPTVFMHGDIAGARSVDAERVYLVGKPPGVNEIIAEAADAEIYLDGHYPIVKYGGQVITWAGTWFGDGEYTPADCYNVWDTLRGVLGAHWPGQQIALLATPATTGRDLWVRTVPEAGYPVLGRALQADIAAECGQGRIEVLPGSGLVRLHEYDARLAYLAVTRGMPVGWPVQLDGPAAGRWIDAYPYAPARATVTFTVPDGWRRPGILPVKSDVAAEGWFWPRSSGQTYGPTTVENSELFTARRAGWETKVISVIGWEQTADVFGPWQKRLLKAIEHGAGWYRGEPVRSAMFRQSIRALALHAIGAMHGAPHKVTHVGHNPAAEARAIRYLGDGRMVWHTVSDPAWPQMCHPEWTATIWGRARARLLAGPNHTGALYVPAGEVAAFRTDAIYTSAPTGWEQHDNGEPGRYRLKGVTRQVPWPRTGLDVLNAKAPAK